MKTRVGLVGWAAAVALSFPLAVCAGEGTGEAFIVLVGIDDYKDPQIKKRTHSEADVKAIFDLFSGKADLGVKGENIQLFLGSADPGRSARLATRENVLSALHWLEKNATRNDLVIFGFFGNGAPLGERAVYFTTDSTYKDRARNALTASEIEEVLDKLRSQRCVVLLDCNFLGFNAGKDQAPDPNLAGFYREFLGDEGDRIAPNRVVFLASSGLKPSLHLKNRGVFAESILDGLSGKADSEGYEPDGNITVGELAKYVRRTVNELSLRLGKTDEMRVILKGQGSDFTVQRNPAVYPLTSRRLEAFARIAREKVLDRAITEEGTYLRARMPRLVAQQNLRKTYQKLVDDQVDMAAFERERRNILESTRIEERDASRYALLVLKAAWLTKSGFVKDVNTGHLVDLAIRGLYQASKEKIPFRLREKLERAPGMEEADLLNLLEAARTHLGKRADLDEGKDITFSLHNMLNQLDRHAEYIDPETMKRLENDIRSSFSSCGIGVQIRKNFSRDMLQVVTPIYRSPAYQARIFAGDIVTEMIPQVDAVGKPRPGFKPLSTKGMTTEEAVKNLLGPEGTPIKLTIQREGEPRLLEFTVVRAKVDVESVLGYRRNSDDSWNHIVDRENRICYVRLTQFSYTTYRDLDKVMKKLHKEGIKGFILDLRFNPGGLLDAAVKVADLFIGNGQIVTIRPRKGTETTYIGKVDGSYTSFPMVCLVNGGSASASEIVSACLQDHARALILGTRSHGKGSVATIHPFETGGRLKLITATFWRPSGRNLNKASTSGKEEDDWGVTPNKGFLIPNSRQDDDDLRTFQREKEIIRRPDQRGETTATRGFTDRQLEAALEYLRHQIRRKPG